MGEGNKADHSPPHTEPKIRMSGVLPPFTVIIIEDTGRTLKLSFTTVVMIAVKLKIIISSLKPI